jgi:predicted dithiol-disulfide oxidoreductase (DUF899 family)
MTNAKIVSRSEWLSARKVHLQKEKELTRLYDQLKRERAALPWVRVEKNYVFDTATGKRTLAELFDDRHQLLVYHFMFGPDWPEGCPSCSMVGDHMDASALHLAQRDVTLIAVSRATLPAIAAFKGRMGFRFNWVSADESDFNYDFHVSFRPEQRAAGAAYYNFDSSDFPANEGPGLSAFYKDEGGTIFHTYSCYARGSEALVGTYNYLDLAPLGRNEQGLPWPAAWMRHHDRYGS